MSSFFSFFLSGSSVGSCRGSSFRRIHQLWSKMTRLTSFFWAELFIPVHSDGHWRRNTQGRLVSAPGLWKKEKKNSFQSKTHTCSWTCSLWFRRNVFPQVHFSIWNKNHFPAAESKRSTDSMDSSYLPLCLSRPSAGSGIMADLHLQPLCINIPLRTGLHHVPPAQLHTTGI